MDKKPLLLAFVSVLLLSGGVPPVWAHSVERPYEMVVATIREPYTVDPAWAYDTASQELIFNVYEPLIFFDVDRTLPPEEQGKTGLFVPFLATEWSLSLDGLTYTFKIREGVKFHHGATLTTEDVEYSFERWMVQDRSGGPTWMILEPLLYIYTTSARAGSWDWYPGGAKQLAMDIDASVESNSTHVWFKLHEAFPGYPPFLAIIAQSWAGILDKDWAIAHGDWPGTWGYGIDAGPDWTDYNDPEVSPLDAASAMSGTGPYKFDYWTKEVEWSLIRNDEYWQGWPAPLDHQGAGYAKGWFERVTTKFIPAWATRKMMFLAGDIDSTYVPRMHIPEFILNWPEKPEKYVPGVRSHPDLPLLVVSPVMFFNFDIDPRSPYLGPGFDPANPYVIAEDRIPVDFLSDINVRRAFAYSLDYDAYIREVYIGEAKRLNACIPEPVPYFNPEQTGYYFDLALAEEYLRAAWGGELWDKGFTMGVTYNTGNIPRMKACEILKRYVEGINPKFHIEVYVLWWPIYLKQLVSQWLTLFLIGWFADYPDPHNFVYPLMHAEEGVFSGYVQDIQYGQSGRKQIVYYVNGVPYGNPALVINNAYVNQMIENGIMTWNHTERQVIYYELQAIYHDEVPSVPLAYPTGRHWERDWVQGWYYNPIYPGGYYYHYWKGYKGDTDKDYDVDLTDLYNVLIGYGLAIEEAMEMYGVSPGTDVDRDGMIDLDDLYHVLIEYG